jgi:6-phosphofructokinase 1
MFRKKEFGHMVAFKNNQMISVPLDSAVAKLKTVDPSGQMVHLAQKMGIYFGN